MSSWHIARNVLSRPGVSHRRKDLEDLLWSRIIEAPTAEALEEAVQAIDKELGLPDVFAYFKQVYMPHAHRWVWVCRGMCICDH